MPTERLRAQDATLWCVQAPESPLQIGALCLFEAGPLLDDAGAVRMGELRRHVASRLDRFPRMRQRLAPVPLDLGRPMWVDDANFDIANHVRAAALPHPGDEAQLRELVSRLIEVPLDPRRPLWELWVVEGVEGDRVAVVPKVSHVMADGMAVLMLSLSLLDPEPRAHPGEPGPWQASPAPAAGRMVVDGLADRARRGLGVVRGAGAALTRPGYLVDRVAGLAVAGATTAKLAPDLPLTLPVGPHRDFHWVGLPMAELLDVKRSQGVTLNDVALAIAAGGLRHYLEQRTDVAIDPDVVRPRVLVPVSTHTTAVGETENRFSMMVADLPLTPDDPVERLRRVHAEMVRRKQSAQQSIGPMLFSLGDVVPERVLRAVGPALLRRQPFVNLAVSNLPGTRQEMFLLGSRMLALYPYIAVTGNIGVIIGMLSYGEILGVGITVDADIVPDADALALGIEQASRRLVDAAAPARRGRGRVTARG